MTAGPRLVAITGPDGSGKSTLARALVAHFGDLATTVRLWDGLPDTACEDHAREYAARLGDRSRALLVLHGVARALELGCQRGARIVVLDGYWYKYAVSELELGAPPELFAACEHAFPRPELTVRLDLPPDEALRRKGRRITRYERGLGREAGPDEAAFLAFQARLAPRWAALEHRLGPWVHLSAEAPVGTLVEEVAGRVGSP